MKRLNQNLSGENIQDKAAAGIAATILKMQHGFAGGLKGLTKSWRRKQQWVFLYLFCLVFGGLSFVAITNAFKPDAADNHFIPASITVPKAVYENNSPVITKEEFQQVQEYRRMHPDLLKKRTGLADSLDLIEQSYYSQKK